VVAGLGRTEEGLAMLEGAVADWSAMGTRTFFCFNPCLLADVLLRAGRHDEALSLVERTLAAVPGQEDRNHWSELYRLKGDVLRSGGAPPAAVEEQLQRSLEIARQQAARSFELRSAMSLARLQALRADQGSREEARRQLAAVYDGTEGLETPDLVAARELLAQLA
jgi:tetratricopeptide (TPR) repeat protein